MKALPFDKLRAFGSIAFLFLATAPAEAAWCIGADPCTACKDCSRCAYCNPSTGSGPSAPGPHGSCGVLRNLTPEQQKKRNKRLVKS